MACSITLINHATVLIQCEGCNILTDPIYANSISFFIPRLRRPGLAFDELPPIHLILISHSDYDHLNFRTLRRLRQRFSPTIVFPRGLGKYGKRTGYTNIVELEYWQECSRSSVRLVCVPAQHSGTRMLLDKTPACGFILQTMDRTVYFAGDTGYGTFLKDLGSRFSIDIAILPIGAYKPYEWFKNIHLHPTTALRAFLDLGAKHLIPIHWGTFKISDEPMAEPPLLLAKEAERLGVQDRVHILENGGRFVL
jgi:L-ascorbate metabolism protein UlaG (beta-lactamase superfamily)